MYYTIKIKDKEFGFDTTIIKRILLIIIALFFVINIKVVGAIFSNTTRFISGSAKRYEKNIEYFKECLEKEQTTIIFDNISSGTERNRLAHEILEGTPEIFYIGSMSYSHVESTVTFYISYSYTGAALEFAKKDFNDRLDAICSNIDPKASDYEKAVFIHDYIENNYTYDYDKVNTIHDAYRMLLNNKGVCSAYANLYKALCNKVGLDAEIVWTKLDNHAWNIIKLNGFWYHVDVTWDDTGAGDNEYFLKPDVLIWGGGHHQWTNCGKYVIPCFRFKYMFK